MKKDIGTRRDFIKSAGLGAAAISVARYAKAAQPTQKRTVTSTWSSPTELCKVDVLVVGGGPAGIGAALGAAKAGADTLLIENHSFFGGVSAWGLGMPINQMRPGNKGRSVIHELIFNKLRAYGDQAVRTGKHQLWCNVDYLKVALLDSLDHIGCNYLVDMRAVDTVMEGNRVAGVIVATKRGPAIIRAKAVVDCTGDGDIAYCAGAETMTETGNLSPITLHIGLTNITGEKANLGDMRKVSRLGKDKYPLIPKGWDVNRVSNTKSCFYINHSGTRDIGQFDATDPYQRSEVECISRRQVLQMVQAMREYGHEKVKGVELSCTGPQVGVRESRRVKGPYILTEEDAITGRKFQDTIAWRSGFLDIGFVRMSKMKIHDVPYRAILPEKVDGLLVAGRCISASHVAASAGKSMGNCVATGHAAGLAAALSAKKKIMPRDLEVATIQQALRADEVDLDRSGDDQEGLVNRS